MEKSPDDPSQRSFMGKVKAFEKMDHIARTQRVLELQEAQIARVSYLAHFYTSYTNHLIYRVNVKTQNQMLRC